MFVPVVDSNKNPLMPTTPSRARRMIKVGEATPFFRKGIFCVRLNREPSDRKFQDVALGIDPGSKKEGYTVKSEAHTFLNITVDAKTDVKNKIESRRNARRARRFRKTPCRKNRLNRSRSKNHIPDFFVLYEDQTIFIEVKGYVTEKDIEKWRSFKGKLHILKLKDIEQLEMIQRSMMSSNPTLSSNSVLSAPVR
jgi:hypothetical protein